MSLVEKWVSRNQLPLRKGSKSQIFLKNLILQSKQQYQMLSDPRFLTAVIYVRNPSLKHRCPKRWTTLGDGTGCSMRENESHDLQQRKK